MARNLAQLAEASARGAALVRRQAGTRTLLRSREGGAGGSIRLARLMSWYQPGDDPVYPDKATAFYGYLIGKIGEAFADVPPPPQSEMLLIWPFIYPPWTAAGTAADLRMTLPAIPLGLEYYSDVPVQFFPHADATSQEGNGRWYVLFPFIGVCI